MIKFWCGFLSVYLSMMGAVPVWASPLGECDIRYVSPQNEARGVPLNPVFRVGVRNLWSLSDCQKQLTLREDSGRVISLHPVWSSQWQGKSGGQTYARFTMVPSVWLESNRNYTLSWRGRPYVSFTTGRQVLGRMVSFSPAAFPSPWCSKNAFYSPADVVSCLSGLNRSHGFLGSVVKEALQSPRGFPFSLKVAMARYMSALPSGDAFLRHAWVIYPQGRHFSSIVVLPSLRNHGPAENLSLAMALIAAEKGHMVLLPYTLSQESVPGNVGILPDTFDLSGVAGNVSDLISALRAMPAFSDALSDRPEMHLYGAGVSAPEALATMQQLLVEAFPVGQVFLSRGLFNAYQEADVQMESLRYGTRYSSFMDKTYFNQPGDFLAFLKKFAWTLSYRGILGLADPFYLSSSTADFARSYLIDFPFDSRSAIRGLLADVSLADSSFVYHAPRATVHFYRFHSTALRFSPDIVDALSSARQRIGTVRSTLCQADDRACDVQAARDFLRALPLNSPLGQSDSWDQDNHNADYGDDDGYDDEDDFDSENDGYVPPPSASPPPSGNTVNNIVVGVSYWDSHDSWHHHHHHYPRVIPSAAGFPAEPARSAVIPSATGFPAAPARPAVIPSATGFPAVPARSAVIPSASGFPAQPRIIVPSSPSIPAFPAGPSLTRSQTTVLPSTTGFRSAGPAHVRSVTESSAFSETRSSSSSTTRSSSRSATRTTVSSGLGSSSVSAQKQPPPLSSSSTKLLEDFGNSRSRF